MPLQPDHRSPSIRRLFDRYGRSYTVLATLTVMLGTLSMTLATTIVNVAIPDVMAEFGIGQAQAQWLASGYLAAMTACMLATAWAVRQFGMRGAYLAAMVVFMIAAVTGAAAEGAGELIAARVLMGGMAGIIQPLALLIIFQVYPSNRRGFGMGLYGLGVILGPAIGPLVGGILVDLYSWRSVFYMPLPFCVLGTGMAVWFLPGREQSAGAANFDWLGFAQLGGSIALVLLGLSEIPRIGVTEPRVWFLLVSGGLLALLFIRWELQSVRPLVDLRIFGQSGFGLHAVLAFMVGAGLFGTTYLIPLLIQKVHGLSATDAGLVLLPAGLIMALTFPLAGHVSDRWPGGQPLVIGVAMVLVSCVAFGYTDMTTTFGLLAALAVVGRLGLGLLLPSVNGGALRNVSPTQLPEGAAAINFSRQLGGAVGVNAIAVGLDLRLWQTLRERIAGDGGPFGVDADTLDAVRDAARAAGELPETQLSELLGSVAPSLLRVGYEGAFQDSFLYLAMAYAGAMLIAIIVGRRPASKTMAARR